MQDSWPALHTTLKSLPEPVLLVGNKSPDGDSVSTLVALLGFFRELHIDAQIYFHNTLPSNLSWVLDHENLSLGEGLTKDASSYASLVVVDDTVTEDRLGIEILDVPIVNIDHHKGNLSLARFPDPYPFFSVSDYPDLLDRFLSFLDSPDFLDPYYFSSEDSSSPRYLLYETELGSFGLEADCEIDGRKVSLFWADVPATSCILIDYNIQDPILWVGLATDSVYFSVDNIVTSSYVKKLRDICSFEEALSDSLVSFYQRKLRPKLSTSSFGLLYGSRVELTEGRSSSGRPVKVIFAELYSETSSPIKEVLSVLCLFADVVVLQNRADGKVSLRSSFDDILVRPIAQKYGGGGHDYAAGCSMDTESPFITSCQFGKLKEDVLSSLGSHNTSWYL